MRRRIQSIFISTALISGVLFTAFGFLSNSEEITKKYSPRKAENIDEASAMGALQVRRELYGDPATGEIKFDEIRNNYLNYKAKQTKSGRSIGMNWQLLGPANIGGRSRALIVDKDDNDVLVVGAVSGGIFRSTSGGNRWERIENNDAVMISSGCQTSNGNMYLGTGSTFGEDFPGTGIYKSTDRGLTWTQIASTVPADPVNGSQSQDWTYVNDLAAHPSEPNTIYAATNTGLFISTDGGSTWTKPQFTAPAINSGICQDIIFSGDNQRIFVGYSGRFVYSDNFNDGASYQVSTHSGAYIRQKIATSADDPNKVYVATVAGGARFGQLDNIFVSDDNGVTFKVLDPAPPITSANWDLSGAKRDGTLGGGQGWYDWAFTADPQDADRFFIGAVQMWRFDGNWTRATVEGGGPPFYVHADKHEVYFDPVNPNIMYTLSDGGVSKSLDRGVTYFDVNRDYVSTQFYGIALTNFGAILGGTQDNGNIGVDPTGTFSGGNPDFGSRVFNQGILNGDGFDCEISQIVDVKFTTAQNGNLGRSKIESFSGAGMCGAYCGQGPFWSVHKLWESDSDPTSQDSVEFAVDTFRIGIGIGSGAKKTYTGTLVHPQPAARIVYSSVYFTAGGSVLEDFDGDGQLSGDGTGTVDPTDGTFTLNWNDAPPVNAPLYAYFSVSYEAGDIINLESNTDDLPFTYTLTAPLNPGDEIMVQDPVQSLLAMALSNGIVVARGVLNLADDVRWINITNDGVGSNPVQSGYFGGTPRAMEFTPDGNSLFVGVTNGRLYRIDNLNQLYRKNVLSGGAVDQNNVNNLLDIKQIFNAPGGRPITGLAPHPDNPEVLVVTLGGYSGDNPNTSWIYMIDNAVSTTGAGTTNAINVRGDLPSMPIFDAEMDVRDPSICLIGTAFGVFSTTNIFASNVEWADENDAFGLAYPPVYDIRQQKLDATKAMNHEMYYLGTHGYGFWSSGALVSNNDIEHLNFNPEINTELTVFPNPAQDFINLNLDITSNAVANIQIFDLNGKVVTNIPNKQLAKGNNVLEIPVSTFNAGVYFTKVEVNGKTEISKFLKR